MYGKLRNLDVLLNARLLVLQTTNKRGKVTEMMSRYFLLAMGGRPKYPDVPGLKEYCISRCVLSKVQNSF